MKPLVPVALAVSVLATQAQANHYLTVMPGEAVIESCADGVAGTCGGYIVAVFESMSANDGHLLGHRMCFTGEKIDGNDIARRVRLFMQMHPERWGDTGVDLVAFSLSELWPCS